MLICKHTTKNLGAFFFLASSYIVSGIHPAQLPKTIPLKQVLRKQLHMLLLPKGLNMTENQAEASMAQPRLQDHHPSFRYSVNYK